MPHTISSPRFGPQPVAAPASATADHRAVTVVDQQGLDHHLGPLAGAGGQRSTDAGSTWATMGPTDRLAPFRPAILAVRWATTVASVALASPAFLEPELTVVPWVAAIVANTVIRTISPLEYDGSTRNLINLLIEVGFHVLALCATGFWDSPLVFSLVNAVIIAGFARGFGFGLRIAGASALAVTIPSMQAGDWSATAADQAIEWTIILGVVGVVAGYARRISGEASRQQSIALHRLNRLSDANALLFNLHRIAQTLPASLDQNEVVESTITRLRGLIDFDAACILTVEDSDGTWIVARRQAMTIGPLLELNDLPAAARAAIDTRDVHTEADLQRSGAGFNERSAVGLYAPLLARGALIGVLCVESREAGQFRARDRQVLQSFVEPVALAIDNARWFARLRTVGADEERTRIARDLHDRIGQSLAYLGFEVDRIVRKDEQQESVSASLEDLRRDLRNLTGEVRDTLYDLRTDVGSDKDFAVTVEEFAGRVAERSNLIVDLDCDEGDRLPILQERELWRIAQEALINIERHANATTVTVTWRCNGTNADLDIVDDGCGFPIGKSGRQDSYGILGMRERASSIGATLELTSMPGEGTRVRCNLAQA